MQASLQDKQKFLRSEIIDSGVDPQSFMAFMGTIKEQGQNINLENWSLAELKEVVQQFKRSLQEQINRAKKQISALRNSKDALTSMIMQSIQKKQKVFYDRDDLWDFQMHTEQQCKKIQKVFQFKSDPEVDYKSWEIKKTGGFIFGIGAKNQLQITLITNFTANTVVRKSEDVDWLRQTLCSKYPGSYVPPLEESRFIEPDDKVSIMRRVKQVILFLNSLVNFEHLAQNKYFYMFIQQKDARVFNAFRTQQTAVRTNPDITMLQNLQGKFKVEISKRVINFIRDSSQFGRQADQIYISLQANMRKILGDLETLTKHTHYIANDFAKFHDKYNKMSQKCRLGESQVGQKMSNILVFLNNMYTNMGNQFKKQMSMIKQMADQFIRYSHSTWSEFMLHQKRYNHQLNNYLSIKYNLIKKKERNFNDVSKWELDQKQQFRMSRMNTAKMDREEAYEIMFPKDNRIEQQTRIWQAYINDMYEKTFKILINEQEKQFIKNFDRFCAKLQKLTQQQNQMYKRFRQIFVAGGKGKIEAKIMQNKE